jgi:hypothetical protein
MIMGILNNEITNNKASISTNFLIEKEIIFEKISKNCSFQKHDNGKQNK